MCLQSADGEAHIFFVTNNTFDMHVCVDLRVDLWIGYFFCLGAVASVKNNFAKGSD